jgi:hypothetical protein
VIDVFLAHKILSRVGLNYMKSILIYIPSYTDYLLARENIIRIRRNSEETNVMNRCKVIISLSINGVNLTELEVNDFKSISDEFHYFPFNIGADTNIYQGYLRAQEIQPDYFWIVSANEFIQPRALDYLCDLIQASPDADFFIANANNRMNVITPRSIFTDFKENSAIGLITSTIYKFNSTHKFYFMANKWHWTGWGQLAVIQSVLLSKDSSIVVEYPDHYVYTQPYSYNRITDVHLEEHTRNLYHDSFFSQVVLAAYFMSKDKKSFRRYFTHFLMNYWYQINYFRYRRTDLVSIEGKLDPLYSEKIFRLTIRSMSFILFIVVKILFIVPVYKFKNNKLLVFVYKKYKMR